MPSVNTSSDAVLRTWFGTDLESPAAVAERVRSWFGGDPALDDLIHRRFGTLPARALEGHLDGWRAAPRSALARILVLDQFPRNLHRGSARAFACDAAALEAAKEALAAGADRELHPLEAAFLYLPFEHAEDRAAQAQSVSLFRQLFDRAPAPLFERFEAFLGYAEQHQAVVEQFGRFPHRNDVLGRESTAAEQEFLRSGGETFSGSNGAS